MAGTRWVKIDIGYLTQPEDHRLAPSTAVMLHLASILWTADQLHGWPDHRQSATVELGQKADIDRAWIRRRATRAGGASTVGYRTRTAGTSMTSKR